MSTASYWAIPMPMPRQNLTQHGALWQFPLSAEQKQAIQSWTKEMLQAGIIQPSSSPNCSPTFCVRKKNGEWRIVHDFRGLNAKVRVPIPRKDDILRDLARGKMFSSMDLLWGFFQVKLREDSIPFTAFATPAGLYEYLVTPMGVATLKAMLASPPVLAHPNFTKPFHVSVDASDFAIGGYLFQLVDDNSERIIAYGGQKLTQAELVYPTREKELLAALHAMRTWKVLLIDKPFFINTDHHTIENILQQQTCSQRLARWLNELALVREPTSH
ncbi:unnamed protein product [Phytophthora lilii]|uniref:Unnamed protein product n=1 Tax=Phytophthora lilii TaxID=2077276 RepID=A0A9W6X421_9STRA|nr:unnamed protein product [Phytophthora lilii]